VSRLVLRRGTVAEVESEGPVARVRVEVAGEQRPAIAYTELTGPVEAGDDVVVNCAALDLGLGSGGFDIVHVNLTRGLDGHGADSAHVMKLNYTSLQHAVRPFEESEPGRDVSAKGPVAVIALHAQLPCVAWAAGQRAKDARVGYVQSAGGALPGALSDVVRELRVRGLLAAHVTAGPSFGGEYDAITVAGALRAGFASGWDAAVVGPGPGIIGSGTDLGHGGLAALDNAHAALALGYRTLVVPRMSEGDPRERHQGLSHHSAQVLEMLLAKVLVALPEGAEEPPGGHETARFAVDLQGYAGSGLPARTMGRSLEEDELFFKAALAGGEALAREINGI
jgi:hypothetical protein